MRREVLISVGLEQARQAAKSMEFIRQNLERIASYLPKDRRVRDFYRQLVYDTSVIFSNLHDELEAACLDWSTEEVAR